MIITLTGLAGSGKTTISNIFKELGANIISADKLGHRVLNLVSVKKDLIEEFGKGILKIDGSVSRKKLAAKAFVSKSETDKLNSITHPFIKEMITESIVKNEINVIEAALFYELELDNISDKVFYVKTDQNVVRQRVKDDEFLKRNSFIKEIKSYDVVIDNNQEIKDTRNQIIKFWEELTSGELDELR